MASMPNREPEPGELGRELDFGRVGTPEFEAEYRRQMLAIAEHDRRTKNASRMEVHWDSLDSWQ